jgi:hypothetical protein
MRVGTIQLYLGWVVFHTRRAAGTPSSERVTLPSETHRTRCPQSLSARSMSPLPSHPPSRPTYKDHESTSSCATPCTLQCWAPLYPAADGCAPPPTHRETERERESESAPMAHAGTPLYLCVAVLDYVRCGSRIPPRSTSHRQPVSRSGALTCRRSGQSCRCPPSPLVCTRGASARPS